MMSSARWADSWSVRRVKTPSCHGFSMIDVVTDVVIDVVMAD